MPLLNLRLNLSLIPHLFSVFLKSFVNDSNMEYQTVYLQQNLGNGQITDRGDHGLRRH